MTNYTVLSMNCDVKQKWLKRIIEANCDNNQKLEVDDCGIVHHVSYSEFWLNKSIRNKRNKNIVQLIDNFDF